MRPSDFWPSLIRELCREHAISIRELSARTGIQRDKLKRILKGEQRFHTDTLETILAFFGYELDAFPRKREAE